VDDVKQENLKQDAPPAIYRPLAQVRQQLFLQSMSYVVRSTAPMTVVESMARGRLREIDAKQPIFNMATMQDLLVASTAEPRFYSRILSSFSVIALALAVVGIYGVISYGVSQGTREIGIRVALGAKPGNILAGVLARNGMLVGLGIVLGIGGASALTRVLKSFLFEVEPTDPATFMAVTALLVAAALAATYIPARRATRVDAMEALRYE
jgi:ABC-type antimicrobial peptide transport system permease subunit